MPESLIFDIDGTLWNSTALVARGYNAQLRDEGLEDCFVTPEDLKGLFGRTMTEIADVLFSHIPVPERYRLMERCMAREEAFLRGDPCRVGYPGVKETLTALSGRHRLFIVSNSQKGYPELVVEKLGLQGLFTDHLCFGDTGKSKGETIRRLMEKNGISDAVYIGDTQGDLEASVYAGIPFVFCRFGFGSPERYDAAISGFSQLTTLF